MSPNHQHVKLAFERGQVLLALSTAAVGGVLGWTVPLIFGNPSRLELWLVTAAALLVITVSAVGVGFYNLLKSSAESALSDILRTVAEFKSSSEQELSRMLDVNRDIQKLVEQSIGRQAELIAREEIYKVMARSIREARTEVAIITYLMVDWESGKRTFLPAAVDTPYRGEFYDAVYEAIKNPNIQYIRVWEVPHSKISQARKVIEADEYHKKECTLIDEIAKNRPHEARLIFADQLTTASFILIDRTHLFLNVDFYDPTAKIWHSPYMLFIKDASGNSFKELQGIIVRLTERA
jgi:hypothetical protein